MEIVSTIVAALVAGAAAASKDVAGQAVKAAYSGLKSFLGDKLKSLSVIEQAPANEAFQNAAKEELKDSPLVTDPEFMKKIEDLLDALKNEPSTAYLEESKIDIQRLDAAKDVVVKHIEALGSVTITDVKAGGKIDISDIHAGGTKKKI